VFVNFQQPCDPDQHHTHHHPSLARLLSAAIILSILVYHPNASDHLRVRPAYARFDKVLFPIFQAAFLAAIRRMTALFLLSLTECPTRSAAVSPLMMRRKTTSIIHQRSARQPLLKVQCLWPPDCTLLQSLDSTVRLRVRPRKLAS